jgi:hypothetical protein
MDSGGSPIMARVDRRQRIALDESYRYYRTLENGVEPRLFDLSRSLCTVTHALYFAESGQFKLTKHLWRRLQQSFFERLLSSFPGKFTLMDANRKVVDFGCEIPEDGFITFRADGCKRGEDVAEIEIDRLYSGTLAVIAHTWRNGKRVLRPIDFSSVGQSHCDKDVCTVKPMVLGHEVLTQESRNGKQIAYDKWWQLYWQAYCTPNKQERGLLYRDMLEIEAVWGNLYY